MYLCLTFKSQAPQSKIKRLFFPFFRAIVADLAVASKAQGIAAPRMILFFVEVMNLLDVNSCSFTLSHLCLPAAAELFSSVLHLLLHCPGCCADSLYITSHSQLTSCLDLSVH